MVALGGRAVSYERGTHVHQYQAAAAGTSVLANPETYLTQCSNSMISRNSIHPRNRQLVFAFLVIELS